MRESPALGWLGFHLEHRLRQGCYCPNTTRLHRRREHTHDASPMRVHAPLDHLAALLLAQVLSICCLRGWRVHSTQVGRRCCHPNTTQHRSRQSHTSANHPQQFAVPMKAVSSTPRKHATIRVRTKPPRHLGTQYASTQQLPRAAPRGECRTIIPKYQPPRLRQSLDALHPCRQILQRSQSARANARAEPRPG